MEPPVCWWYCNNRQSSIKSGSKNKKHKTCNNRQLNQVKKTNKKTQNCNNCQSSIKSGSKKQKTYNNHQSSIKSGSKTKNTKLTTIINNVQKHKSQNMKHQLSTMLKNTKHKTYINHQQCSKHKSYTNHPQCSKA